MSERAYAGRRVLVTGASGFIGTRLTGALVAAGADVHAVARTAGPAPDVRWWAADLADPEAAAHVVRAAAPEIVFHLAGHVSGDRSLAAVLPTVRGNLLSTVNLLAAGAGQDTPPRLVLAGSMEEPGGDGAGPPSPGRPTRRPRRPRAATPACSTPCTTCRSSSCGCSWSMARAGRTKPSSFPTSHGPSSPASRPASRAAPGRSTGCTSTTSSTRSSTPASTTGSVGHTVDVGSGELTTIGSVVERVAALVGNGAAPRFGALPDRPLDARAAGGPPPGSRAAGLGSGDPAGRGPGPHRGMVPGAGPLMARRRALGRTTDDG